MRVLQLAYVCTSACLCAYLSLLRCVPQLAYVRTSATPQKSEGVEHEDRGVEHEDGGVAHENEGVEHESEGV